MAGSAVSTPVPRYYPLVQLTMNLLVPNPGVAHAEATEVWQAEHMEELGAEVTPVGLRDAFAFGGSLDSCTAEVEWVGDCFGNV